MHLLGADQTLGERLRAAERFTTDIKGQIEAAESVLARVTQIAALRSGTAQAPRQNQPDTKAIMAAAQAFADRKRSRAQGLAA